VAAQWDGGGGASGGAWRIESGGGGVKGEKETETG